MEKSELVTLMEFTTLGEAEIYKALLDSAGIPSVVQNDLLAGMIPVVGPLLDIKLVVSAEDEAQAREVLSARFDEDEFEQQTRTGAYRRRKTAAGTAKTKATPAKGSKETSKTRAGTSAAPKAAGARTASKKTQAKPKSCEAQNSDESPKVSRMKKMEV